MGAGMQGRPQPMPRPAPQQRPMAAMGQAPRPNYGGAPMPGQRPMGNMMSDERSKEEIQRLESTNEALTKALDVSAAQAPGGNLPATQYPQLPANTRVPSMGNFADTPAANTVAAQNVGLQGGAPPPPAMQPSPQQSNFGRSTSSAFQGVGGGRPDLSQLDEAYKRMGQGG
jgi:hypothetical protein